MNYIMRSYDADQKPSSSLSVYECGWQQCGAGHSLGIQHRDYYCIHYIIRGCGTYRRGEQLHHLQSGDGFVILPGEEVIYCADTEDPWEYYWVGFHGSEAPFLLEKAGLGAAQVTFSYTQDDRLQQLLEDLYSASSEYTSREYAMIGYLYLFFSCLIRSQKEILQPSMQYVRKACTYIQTSYPEGIHVQNVAEYVGLERSYLHRIFKQALGFSVHDYLQQIRLTRAQELLDAGLLSITEIAAACGFESASYFSRAFKQAHGVSPQKYRNTGSIRS